MNNAVSDISFRNLLAICIMIGGLFVGSLFVDIGQLMLGRGFSQHVVREHEVLEQSGKTWVAYRDPKVELTIVTDTTCALCDTDEALIWLRRVLPTLSVTRVEVDSESGRALIAQHALSAVPAFIFSSDVSDTDFYAQATSLFQASGKGWLLDMRELGLPPGRYLQLPNVTEKSVVIGKRDAPAIVIVYSDFQCHFCATFHRDQIKRLLSEYSDRVAFVFKSLPLDTHPKAPLLAQAALCAHEQGKYLDYAGALYSKQREIEHRSNTKQELKNIAWATQLNWKSFSDCLDQDRFKNQVEEEVTEAHSFGIAATPAIFIGDRFISGTVEYDTLRHMIEGVLNEAH